jgi:hypothetical protein
LVENNVSLRDLAAQELELRLRHSSKGGAAITASLHLDAAKDLLRLDAEAIAHLASNGVPTFNASGNVVSVLLEFLGSRDDLPVLGVVPAGQAGDLFVGWANLERVRELAAHVAVAHVETMSAWVAHVETMSAPSSAGGAGARVAAASPGPERGLTGRGVCLAVIDLGFDFLHPGLLDEKDGIEAVRALWLHDMRLARPASAPPGRLAGGSAVSTWRMRCTGTGPRSPKLGRRQSTSTAAGSSIRLVQAQSTKRLCSSTARQLPASQQEMAGVSVARAAWRQGWTWL